MKRIIIILAFLFSVVLSFGQVRSLKVADTSENFPIEIPSWTVVVVTGDTAAYLVRDHYDTSQNMHDVITDGEYSIITSKPIRLGAYVPEDSVQTTTVLADTWTFLGAGSGNKFVNIHSTDNFSFNGDTLVYNDGVSYLYIEYGGTISVNSSSETVHFGIFIDDVEQAQFTGATYCKTSGEFYSIAGLSNIVQISSGQTIKIMVKSDSPTTITTMHFSIAAHKIR